MTDTALASWNDGMAKEAILAFVSAVTTDGPDFVPKIIEAEPFDAFTVHPASVAVYHLGNNGTARKLLKAWPVTNF
jgi:hypothetical protein